jgi:hypothetical protein
MKSQQQRVSNREEICTITTGRAGLSTQRSSDLERGSAGRDLAASGHMFVHDTFARAHLGEGPMGEVFLRAGLAAEPAGRAEGDQARRARAGCGGPLY